MTIEIPVWFWLGIKLAAGAVGGALVLALLGLAFIGFSFIWRWHR